MYMKKVSSVFVGNKYRFIRRLTQSCILDKFNYGIICGGYVRDFLLGRKPKDLDIFLVGDRNNCYDFYNQLKIRLPEIFADAKVEVFENYEDGGTLLIEEVYKVTLKNMTIDIVKFAGNIRTPLDVIENFDYNFNCCFIHGVNIYSLKPYNCNKVHIVNKANICHARKKRMKDKGFDFDWGNL